MVDRSSIHVLLIGVSCSLMLARPAVPAERPNVVLIISDDQGWTDYGFMGHAVVQTPHLDALARSSALFRRGYVPTALCRPSLMTLATGLYAHQHGVTGNDPSPALASPDSDDYASLRQRLIDRIDQLPTLAVRLADVGYRSHQSGKWWEGSYHRGGFTHGMTRGFPERGGRHGDDGLTIGREGIEPICRFIDEAVGEDRPFFVWYAPFLPHTPHNPPERIEALYQQRGRPSSLAKYYAMCHWFDETVGELLAYLDQKNVRRNTIVAYVTDNGWIQRTEQTVVPEGWRTSFAPRSKQSPYEGGIRTPIMFHWPGVIAPQDRSEVVSSLDLMPTLCAAAAVTPPKRLPGLNLLPLIVDGKPLVRQAVFGESFAHDIADLDDPSISLLHRWCIEGNWKLIVTFPGRVNRYGAVHAWVEKDPQLFDLATDPHEEHNLAASEPEIVQRLARRINHHFVVRTVKK